MTRPSGPRFPQAGGPQGLVEIITACLILAAHVEQPRTTLARLTHQDAPADEPGLEAADRTRS